MSHVRTLKQIANPDIFFEVTRDTSRNIVLKDLNERLIELVALTKLVYVHRVFIACMPILVTYL